MHLVSLASVGQYFSHSNRKKPDRDKKVYLVNLDWNIVRSKPENEQMGLPGNIAQDVSHNAEYGWGGWGFYTLNDESKGHVISSIPVLLLRSKKDAFVFRLKYPGANWVPTISTDEESDNVKYS